ncbi:zinc finger BED domain-containing protein 1-like [Thalassophryne amazonica]|uniref:zinc finger BED domain-containing protein 1-like n=1 Tax=Thalassophryne amazonica TaxID=390379 RepID=UPI00147202D8|nr:zinc finger BED domain-containing protein 1-like [Thalassophryne amazonica]
MASADKDALLELEAAPASLKSAVWKYFAFAVSYVDSVRVVDKKTTVCKMCYTRVPYPATGNTTNMAGHIRRHHKDVDLAGKTSSLVQPTIDSSFVMKLAQTSARAKAITNAIGLFIAAGLQPYSVVENAGFKHLISVLEPRYSIPSRSHLTTRLLPSMYEDAKEKVLRGLSTAELVAITTDGWTSRATESYITVTAHYVNNDWEIESPVLQTRPIYESHTSDNLAEVLKEAVLEWKLDKQNTTIPVTTDNAKNIVNASNAAGLSQHIGFFAHTENLASQKGLGVNQISRLLSKVRRVVTFFHKSTTAAVVLKAKQEMLQLPPHKLIQDVTTRWNSSYDMLKRYLEQQAAVYSALTEKDVKKNAKDLITLSDQDVTVLEDVVEVLKPMKTITTLLSSEQQPTVSMILPLKHSILTTMKHTGTDSQIVKDVKSAIATNIEGRYSDLSLQQFLNESTALDPRFKSLPHLDDPSRKEIFNSLAEKILQKHPTQTQASGNATSQYHAENPETAASSEGSPPAKRITLSELFGDFYSTASTTSTTPKSWPDVVKEEIELYRMAKVISVDAYPLKW